MTSRLSLFIIILISILLLFFVHPAGWNAFADKANHALHLDAKSYKVPHLSWAPPFRLGLDLLGGAHLEYQADFSGVKDQSPADAMSGVRDVIERRVNLFGVSEPVVQIEGTDRLIVELAGISDIKQAIQLIGITPFLEFREQRPDAERDTILEAQKTGKRLDEDPYFIPTGLSGKHLTKSTLIFDQTTGRPEVSLELNDEGAKLFAAITRKNLNKNIAVYLDGQPISIAVVQSEIPSGKAVISSPNFTPQAAKELVNRLNAGALPVPINLISQQTVGASLGAESLHKSLRAGVFALIAVAIFMIGFYRLPGLAAVLALLIYSVIVLAIYKIVPVTLTLSGIAGFILSLGIAVDANVLIFARLREELAAGRTLPQAVHEGFRRAWYSIRDSHVTTLLGALVLYIFTTSIVKGFALTLGIGVLVSLFSSIIVTRAFMNRVISPWFADKKWLF